MAKINDNVKTSAKNKSKTVTQESFDNQSDSVSAVTQPKSHKKTQSTINKKNALGSKVKKRANNILGGLKKDSKNNTKIESDDYVEPLNSFDEYKTIDKSILSADAVKAAEKGDGRKTFAPLDYSFVERFNPEYTAGLTDSQVEKRVKDGLVNITTKKNGRTYGEIFISNIFTFFNMIVFFVAAALIVFDADLSQLFFLIIIIANITIGVTTEIKSKITVDKLSIMTAPTAIVVRNGEVKPIPVAQVVLDDIIYLETGKQICSDCVVIKGQIEVNEALLTGESEAVKKVVKSELLSGSYVTSGNCYARVNKVGRANYIETLTSYAKSYRKPKSELQNSVKFLIKIITILIVPITILMLISNNYYSPDGNTWSGWQNNIFKVSGAVIGMLPAGMFLLTSTALAASMIRLAKKKAVVQDLYCIEMLARVDVLCLDKTGTITDGTMQVNDVITLKNAEKIQHSCGVIVGSMLTATGDNNQTAMALANHFGYSKALKSTAVMPFSSKRKMSAVSFENEGTFFFGAPEFILKDMGIRISEIVNANASQGYRVLVVAHSPESIVDDKLPINRKPLYLIAIEDHIRTDALETIKWFKENNVEIKVISGDNPITVSEVAKRVGVDKAEMYISLDGLSNQEVLEAATKYNVFGRVTPEQKLLLVKSLKAQGHTVSMTGDGVNDILAMREADCSVAFASGAEATKNISHLVLKDSNFTSMPDVVREGRRVINNIQKASALFLMKTFMSVMLSIIFLLIGNVYVSGQQVFREYPFMTNHLLLFELCIIGLPSFVLALQPNNNLIKGKFISNVIGRCVPGGITLVAAIMLIYAYNVTLGVDNVENVRQTYHTMLVIGLAMTGFILLVKISEPFDLVRTALSIGVAVLLAVGIFAIPPAVFGIWYRTLTKQDALYLFVIVFGAYFLVSILMRIMRTLKILN